MKEMGCQEMFVFYEHIDAVDPEFARSLCMCYERVRNNLSHAVQTFIREDLGDPDFHSEHLSVRICDMPKPDRWIPAKEFFGLPGNHPAEARTIECTDYSLEVTHTTPTGRIALTNLLIKLSTYHMNGRSYNGNFTLDQILVNVLMINSKLILLLDFVWKRHQRQGNLILSELLLIFFLNMLFEDNCQVFFLHLEKSLKVYIDNLRFGASMLQKFHNFITAHPALKASLVRLAVIDDIYTAHQ